MKCTHQYSGHCNGSDSEFYLKGDFSSPKMNTCILALIAAYFAVVQSKSLLDKNELGRFTLRLFFIQL